MNICGLCNIINDAKSWIYGWDKVTYVITVIIICLLMTTSLISFLKSAIGGDKQKFKFFPFLFFGLLTTMLILILVIRN